MSRENHCCSCASVKTGEHVQRTLAEVIELDTLLAFDPETMPHETLKSVKYT